MWGFDDGLTVRVEVDFTGRVEHQSVVSIRPIAVIYFINVQARTLRRSWLLSTIVLPCMTACQRGQSECVGGSITVSVSKIKFYNTVCQMRDREVRQFSAYNAINHTPRCVGCDVQRRAMSGHVSSSGYSLLRGDQHTAWGRWGRLTLSVVMPCHCHARQLSYVSRLSSGLDLH